ncbi:hypothetical protein [Pseudovibrio brasiliensis]|uniref:Lipoprotein n=1 Tax=Pseudovibrio brasiliensis TaxID=1898042 RepID=A0ABX8AWM9_9HYPH|nr:hypothetical protein [Pseudovibrio brasiliensis]QUS59067.1 hypothetical protein KGB56_25980 [Pseudovibrio brasiliensis]
MKYLSVFAFFLLVACSSTHQPATPLDLGGMVKKPPLNQMCGEGEFTLEGSRIVCVSGSRSAEQAGRGSATYTAE